MSECIVCLRPLPLAGSVVVLSMRGVWLGWGRVEYPGREDVGQIGRTYMDCVDQMIGEGGHQVQYACLPDAGKPTKKRSARESRVLALTAYLHGALDRWLGATVSSTRVLVCDMVGHEYRGSDAALVADVRLAHPELREEMDTKTDLELSVYCRAVAVAEYALREIQRAKLEGESVSAPGSEGDEQPEEQSQA